MKLRLTLALTLTLSLAIALGFSACGGSDSASESSGDYVSRTTLDELEAPAHVAARASVSCVTSPCPAAVGMMLGVVGNQTERCTLFAVGDDVVATNSHCIATELKASGSSCSGRLWALFPDNGTYPARTIECDHVVYAAKKVGAVTDVDFAFLKLKESIGRPAFKISRAGTPDELRLMIFKEDPSSDGISGTITSQNCTVKQRTLNVPSFSNALRPIVTMGDCSTIKGNSGSPAVDTDGNVRAIVEGGSTTLYGSTLPFVFATNLACVPSPDTLDFSVLSSECAVTPDSPAAQATSASGQGSYLTAEQKAAFVDALKTSLVSWAKETDTTDATALFTWDLGSIEPESNYGLDIKSHLITQGLSADSAYAEQPSNLTLNYMQPIPTCIKPAALERYHRAWYDPRAAYASNATVSAPMPLWRGALTINDYEQAGISSSELFRVSATFTFSPADAVKASGKTHVRVTTNDLGFLGGLTTFEGDLEKCKSL